MRKDQDIVRQFVTKKENTLEYDRDKILLEVLLDNRRLLNQVLMNQNSEKEVVESHNMGEFHASKDVQDKLLEGLEREDA